MPKANESTKGGIKPIYAVYGPDDFLRRQAIARIVKEVFGDHPPRMGLVDVEGPKADLADVLDELRTLPFLAEVRVVIVHEADAFITAHREALERYAASPSPTGVLILVCDVMNRQWRLTKAVQQVGQLIECKPPPVWERPAWLANRAFEEYGKKLEPAAGATLIELVGNDMAGLDAELAKLAIYVGDRGTITAADVEELVGFSRPENIFRMTDALADRDAVSCLRVWRQTLATDNQAAFRAVGGLAWAVRQMISAKRGGSPAGGRSLERSASRFTMEQLQDILVQLLGVDVASKTGLGTIDSAVEKLVVALCAGRQGRSPGGCPAGR